MSGSADLRASASLMAPNGKRTKISYPVFSLWQDEEGPRWG